MSTKRLIVCLVAFFVVLIGLVFLSTMGQKPEQAAEVYSKNDSDRPKAQVDKNFLDIGEMKVSQIKEADFSLKNAGTKPLQILKVTSSCHCTFSQIIYQGKTSGKFGMNRRSGYVTDIASGETATVKVIYEPALMPVSGIVEREVYVTTNDPDNEKLIFSIQANVK